MKRLLTTPLLALIHAYQRYISPAFPRRCRYEPTCSAYAAESIKELGPLKGAIVASWRLLRCNPFSAGGLDPLADRNLFRHPEAGDPLGRPSAKRERPKAATGGGRGGPPPQASSSQAMAGPRP